MSENIILTLSLISGLILGIFFYSAIWLSGKKESHSKDAVSWFISSGLIRYGVVLFGIYYVGQGDGKRLAFALLGFILARLISTRIPQRKRL